MPQQSWQDLRVGYLCPIVEATGRAGVGRFGWKNQHASLLSFSGDAYLNEMGITTRLFPDEVTKLCNTADEPNDKPGSDGLADVDHFARFLRATKAPAGMRSSQIQQRPGGVLRCSTKSGAKSVMCETWSQHRPGQRLTAVHSQFQMR